METFYHSSLFPPQALSGVHLQQVLALSAEDKRRLRAALLAGIPALIDAHRHTGTDQLRHLLAPFNITYHFYPGRDRLPSKLMPLSSAQLNQFARDPANSLEERLAAIMVADVESSGNATKAMMYRFVETLLQLVTESTSETKVLKLLS